MRVAWAVFLGIALLGEPAWSQPSGEAARVGPTWSLGTAGATGLLGNGRTRLLSAAGCPGYQKVGAADQVAFTSVQKAFAAGFLWADGCSLADGESEAAPAATATEVWMFVSARQASLRAAPTARSRRLGSLPASTRVRITSEASGWLEVEEPDSNVTGWVLAREVSSSKPKPKPLTDEQLRRQLIRESLASYPGRCPCPDNVDAAGRSCGRRSAYYRPGGYAPLCYPKDVSKESVEELRKKLETAEE